MGYAFISYSSENQAQAKKLRRLFEQRSIENWMAPADIPAGARYALALKKAIENCACFVLLPPSTPSCPPKKRVWTREKSR